MGYGVWYSVWSIEYISAREYYKLAVMRFKALKIKNMAWHMLQLAKAA